jgi:hypothetical protein
MENVVMETYMNALCNQPNHLKKALFNNYQFRSTTQWSKEEKQEATKLWHSVGAFSSQFLRDNDPDLVFKDLVTFKYFSNKLFKEFTGESSF